MPTLDELDGMIAALQRKTDLACLSWRAGEPGALEVFIDLDRSLHRLRTERTAVALGAEPAPDPATRARASRTVDREAEMAAGMMFAPVPGAALDDIDRRLRAVESKPSVREEGPFEPGKVYQPGAMVTKAGSVWCAERETSEWPGRADSGWVLAVKRGAPGKSAR